MNLGKLWVWQKKKLPCRIRQESGNPAVDDLRERMAELAGIKPSSLLEESKAKSSNWSSGGNCDHASPRPKLDKEVVRTLNSAKGILTSMDSSAASPSRNIHKKYLTAPKLLPSKLVNDVQRERLKLLMDNGNNGSGPSKEVEENYAEQDEDSADEFLKAVKLRGKKKWKKCGKAKRDKGPNLTTNNANEKAGHQLICAGCSSDIQGGHRAAFKTSSSGSMTATATPITRTPDEELSLVKSDTIGMIERRRVSTATGDSSSVSKTSYQGNFFGTGGNYLEGFPKQVRMAMEAIGMYQMHA